MSISTNTSHRDQERKGRDTIIKGIHSNHATASYFTHANAPAKKKQIQGQTEMRRAIDNVTERRVR
jgi:hypothetical protein